MTPDDDRLQRQVDGLLGSYGRLETQLASMSTLIEERTADALRVRGQVGRELERLDRDKAEATELNALRAAQREAIVEFRDLLEKALRSVDESCKQNVNAVRKEVAELKRQGERAVWSRADKLSGTGLLVLIALSIVGMVIK